MQSTPLAPTQAAGTEIDSLLRQAAAHLRGGRLEQAWADASNAVALAPGRCEAWLALGEIMIVGGNDAGAADALRRAAALGLHDPRPQRLLGLVAVRAGRHEEAFSALRAAAGVDAAMADMLGNLGVALDGMTRREDALAVLRTAALLYPQSALIQDNFGNVLLASGRPVEAEACHRRAMELGASGATTWSNLGNALYRQGRLDESEAAYRQAVSLSPETARYHTNLALNLLIQGRYAEGWTEYEWRWRDHPHVPATLRDKPWDGGDMPSGTLLLLAEQGFGDTLQFIRYAPLLAGKVGRVILACQPELVRLMRTAPGVHAVVPETAPLPEVDAALPLMSLARLFRTDDTNIPGGVPYLSVPRGAGIALPEREGLKVGVAWAGRPTHGDDWNRSIPARLLEPLLAVPGVSFFSLQHGAVAERLGRPAADRVVEAADRCADFADTAAVVAAMDLVVSVDTAIVHLAGAMGKPVWVLLPAVPDFRWRMEGDRSDWYPSMRIFRRRPGQSWEPVMAEIAVRLTEMSGIFRS